MSKKHTELAFEKAIEHHLTTSGDYIIGNSDNFNQLYAVDTDEVYLATKIEGKKTFFLPFNKGFNDGAGNPPTKQVIYGITFGKKTVG